MSDWFSNFVELQREMLRAQQAQVDAAKKMVDAAGDAVKLQQAGQKAAEANLAAWKQWARLWGWK